MNFTNIQICNILNKLDYEEIEAKIIRFKESNGYKLVSDKENKNSENESSNFVKILTIPNSKFITVLDSSYSFKSLKENKSYIRKFSKILTLPVFSVTCIENDHVVIEQYNFNKRVYDYLSIGNLHENMLELGFNDNEHFNNVEIWKEYFVGRNNLDSINEVIKNSKNYADKSYIIEGIFKLYGVNSNMSLYSGDKDSINCEIKTLYFDRI